MTEQEILAAITRVLEWCDLDESQTHDDVWTDYDGSYQPDDYDADGNIK